jgi:hypothetical protein
VKPVVNVQKSKNIRVGDIIARDADRLLPPTETGIKQMAASFEAYGQLQAILVRHVAKNTVKLVVGATRLAAAKRLRWDHVRADVITVKDERDYQIIEIEENMERRDLTDNQRKFLREKKRVLEIEKMGPVEPAKPGRGKKGGISQAAREGGMTRRTAQRRKKTAQNTESAHISVPASPAKDTSTTPPPSPPPSPAPVGNHKSTLDPWKMSFEMTIAERDRLDEFWPGRFPNRGACVREAVRVFVKGNGDRT